MFGMVVGLGEGDVMSMLSEILEMGDVMSMLEM